VIILVKLHQNGTDYGSLSGICEGGGIPYFWLYDHIEGEATRVFQPHGNDDGRIDSYPSMQEEPRKQLGGPEGYFPPFSADAKKDQGG